MIQEIYNVNGAVFSTSGAMRQLPDSPLILQRNDLENRESGESVKISISEETRSAISQMQGENVPVQQTENFLSSDYNSSGNTEKNKNQGNNRKLKQAYLNRNLQLQNKTDSLFSLSDNGGKMVNGKKISEGEEKVVHELEQRDKEVRAHEQRHVAAAGQYVRGGIVYEYQVGPDGNLYAVGGHVNVDTSPVPGDDEATIRKAQIIRMAALASADASSADRAVAAEAIQMEMESRQNILKKERKKLEEKKNITVINSKSSPSASNFRQITNLILKEYGSSSGFNTQTSGSIVDFIIP